MISRPVTLWPDSGPDYESRAALEAAPAIDGSAAPPARGASSSQSATAPAPAGPPPAPRPTGLSDQDAIDRLLKALPERAAGSAPLVERALRGDVLTHAEWLPVTTLVASIDPDTRPDILAGADPFVAALDAWTKGPTADMDLQGALVWLADRIGEQQGEMRRARAQGERIRAALAGGTHRPILVQRKGFVFVADPAGGYQAPLLREDVAAGLPERLEPWVRMGAVDPFTEVGVKNPKKKPKSVNDLIREGVGTVADDIVYGHWQVAQFDRPSRELRLPAGALANIEPKFEPEADRYFALLVGTKAKSKLEDFCAGLTQRDRACAALYLVGPSGTGKSKLVKAMARQWAHGHPVPINKATQKHNDSTLHSQLVSGDETVSIEADTYRQLFEDFQTVEPKNQPVATLRCALRIVLTANSDKLIRAQRQDEAEGLDATARRTIFMRVHAAAGTYLGSLPYDEPALVAMLARHIAWLRQRGVQAPGRRFLVEPDPNDHTMHNNLALSDEPSTLVAEVLIAFLVHPTKNDRVRIGNGEFLVTSDVVWERIRERKQDRFTESMIVEKLGRLATRTERRAPGKGSRKGPRYYQVDVDGILDRADRLGHAADDLRELIDGEAKTDAEHLRSQLVWKEKECERIRSLLQAMEAGMPPTVADRAPSTTTTFSARHAAEAEPDSAVAELVRRTFDQDERKSA